MRPLKDIDLPTLQEIQELMPVGDFELDAQAHREARLVYSMNDSLAELFDANDAARFMAEIRTDLTERLGEDSPRKLRVVEYMAEAAQQAAKRMREQDSTAFALQLAALDATRVAHAATEETVQPYVTVAAQQVPPVVIQAAGTGLIQGLLQLVLVKALYRRFPEVRFPIHRLVILLMGVPEEGRILSATVTGYQVEILEKLQPKQSAFPDVIDTSMFEQRPPAGDR